MLTLRLFSALVILGALSAGQVARAQGRLPGQVERPAPGAVLPESQPELVIPTLSIELPAGTRSPNALRGETVTVGDLVPAGNTVMPTAALADLWQPLLGREVTIAELYAVADAVTRRYVEAGYFLSFAYFPAQSVEDNRYRLEIVEGWVDSVRVTGVEGRLAESVRDRFGAVTSQRPLRLSTLERALLLTNDLAGLTARGVLQPVAGLRGAIELDVTVAHKPFETWMSIDNRGSKYAGPWRGYVENSAYSALGMGELVRARGLLTPDVAEQRFIGLDTRLPIGNDGLRLDLSAAYGDTTPGFRLKSFGIKGRSVLLDAVMGYPIVRSQEWSLVATGGMHWIDSRLVDQFREVFDDHIREVGVGTELDYAGLLGGATRLTAELRRGVVAFQSTQTSSRSGSRPDGKPEAMRALVELQHLQPIDGPWSISFHAEGQYAFDRLFAAQEYALGGQRFGRAYDLGETTGEHGIAGSIELRYLLDDVFDGTVRPQLYAFFDGGAVWERRPAPGGLDTRMSAGVGIRVESTSGVAGYLEYAKPINDAPGTEAPSTSGRVFLGAAVRF